MDFWTEMAEAGPDAVTVNGVELRPGSRVRLCPLPGRDVLDLVLAGRQARVEALEHDQDGNVHLAVTLDDDPGRDLGQGRFPGHRFFFAPEEVEPVEADPAAERSRRILVAGIGNIFLGDDGFGVAVADALIRRE